MERQKEKNAEEGNQDDSGVGSPSLWKKEDHGTFQFRKGMTGGGAWLSFYKLYMGWRELKKEFFLPLPKYLTWGHPVKVMGSQFRMNKRNSILDGEGLKCQIHCQRM